MESLGALSLTLVGPVRDEEALEVELVDHLLHKRISELDVAKLNGRLLWDVILSYLSFLFLELEGNALDGSSLDSLHQMCGVTSNFISQTLRLNNCDVVNDTFVEMEVLGQLAVVLLDDSSGGSLNSLGSD